jgi:hypothetical protein
LFKSREPARTISWGDFVRHYDDSRGVAPYLPGEPERWRLEAVARASGFWPRFTGDGRTIKGSWESSAEGPHWKRDLDLNYVRPGSLADGQAGTGGDPMAAKG